MWLNDKSSKVRQNLDEGNGCCPNSSEGYNMKVVMLILMGNDAWKR